MKLELHQIIQLVIVLGEYSALVASDVLSFEDAVLLVHKRGLFMNEAVPAGEGAMAAILGLDTDKLNEVTRGSNCNW